MSHKHVRCPECNLLSIVFDGHEFACRNEDCDTEESLPPIDLRHGAMLSVVYYLAFADRIKIGVTTDLESRLGALPHDEVLAFEIGDRDTERARHQQFARDLIPGQREWFQRSRELLDLITSLRTPDPRRDAAELQTLALLAQDGAR